MKTLQTISAAVAAILLMIGQSSFAITCESVQSGDWSQQTTWNCDGTARVPMGGDAVYIQAGHKVVIDQALERLVGEPVMVFVYGTLTFANATNKLSLPKDSGLQVRNYGYLMPFGGSTANAQSDLYCTSTDISGNALLIDNELVWAATCGAAKAFSDFGNAMTLMPVRFAYFHATAQGNTVALEWATACESNTCAYTVMKSTDGNNWEWLLDVDRSFALSKEPDGTAHYRLFDHRLQPGTYYFKIGYLDGEDASGWTKVAAVQVSDRNMLAIAPNAIENNTLQIAWSGGATQLEYTVISLNGEVQAEGRLSLEAHAQTSVNLPQLVAGSYLLQASDGQSNFVLRFVKK